MRQKIKAFCTGTKRRTAVTFMTALLIAIIAVCVAWDFIASGGLSWSLLALGALVFVWTPLFLLICKQKNKLYWVVGSMCVLAIPLMLWVDRQGVAQGMIRELGIPVAACCIGYVLFLLLALKGLRKYPWSMKVAACVALLIPLSVVTHILYSAYTGEAFPLMQTLASSLVVLCVALAFFVPSFINRSRLDRKKAHLVQQAVTRPDPPKAG